MAADTRMVKSARVEDLLSEGKEILAIVIASRKTAKARNKKKE